MKTTETEELVFLTSSSITTSRGRGYTNINHKFSDRHFPDVKLWPNRLLITLKPTENMKYSKRKSTQCSICVFITYAL